MEYENGRAVWVERVQAYCVPIILNQKMRLSTNFGSALPATVSGYELEDPYTLVIFGAIKLEMDEYHDNDIMSPSFRVDVTRNDIARELKYWLDGRELLKPCCRMPKSVENNMMKYVKFGSIPSKENLIFWVLSRCEIYKDMTDIDVGKLICMFGGKLREDKGEDIDKLLGNEFEMRTNPLKKTVEAAVGTSIMISPRLQSTTQPLKASNSSDVKSSFSKNWSSVSPKMSKSIPDGAMDRQYNTYIATREMLGQSEALSFLPKGKRKDNKDAGPALKSHELTNDHYRLGAFIQSSRKLAVEKMESRRKVIETAKARQIQTMGHYREVREGILGKEHLHQWLEIAEREAEMLRKIEEEIEDDTRKQKVRAHRLHERAMWQMNPIGTNLGGRSKPGPRIGNGPLPASATSNLRDPAVDSYVEKYYWDDNGRRHRKEPKPEEATILEQALQTIKHAASNSFVQSLDIKKVFQDIDSSGDGHISMEEMVEGIEHMGVHLDNDSARILFQHFDQNGSGSIHFGEFVWAFFNRHGFMRQWRRNTRHLSNNQIREKFHKFDKSGDGQLNLKEFTAVLKSFGVAMHSAQVQTLMDRFDTSGDGKIDMYEFFVFLNEKDSSNGSTKLIEQKGTAKTITKSKDSRGERAKMIYLKSPLPQEKYLSQKVPRTKSAPSRSKVFGHFDDRSSMQSESKQDTSIGHGGKYWTDDQIDANPMEDVYIDTDRTSTAVPISSIAELDVSRIQANIRAQKDLQRKLGNDYYVQA